MDTIWDHSVRSAKTQMNQSIPTVLADHKERLPVQLKLHLKVRSTPSYMTLSLTRSKPIGSPSSKRRGLRSPLAFLFLEIAFIHRFILFLSHPLYTIAVVICAFLVFAGLGSGLAPRLEDWLEKARLSKKWRARPISGIDVAVLAIAILGLLYLALLPALFRAFMPWSDLGKVVVSVLLIAPLAFAMGMPFPLGLSRVSEKAPDLVPWAWGVSGCASVLSAVLAMLLAIHFGFTVVVAIALALYVVAAMVFRAWSRAPS